MTPQKKMLLGLVCGIMGLFFLETLFFSWVRLKSSETFEADAVVVFSGGANRIGAAYRLIGQGFAPALLISPASPKLIGVYEKRYGTPNQIKYIVEPKADTTFTNALYTAALIREHRLESVLLVTSDYHMPRSFFLLKLTTLTTGCRIGIHKVGTHSGKGDGRQHRITRIKLYYNELVQLWGSLAEGVLYWLGGHEERSKTRSSGFSKWLRKILLFEVPCPDCS